VSTAGGLGSDRLMPPTLPTRRCRSGDQACGSRAGQGWPLCGASSSKCHGSLS
jgi:hypothetical protein